MKNRGQPITGTGKTDVKRLMKKLSFIFSMLTLVFNPGGVALCGNSELNSIIYDSDSTGIDKAIKIDPFSLGIVPPSAGVQFYKDGIIFLSLTKNERKMTPKHISFGTAETYYADLNDSVTGKPRVFKPSFLNVPAEAISFSHDYLTVYFTKTDKNVNREKIFKAVFPNGDQIGQPIITLAEFCTDDSNYSHPAVSDDGNMLVFASDRPGSVGGMDLYLTRMLNGKWSVPENMGKLINTSGNEFFPFLDSHNNLFFSSDKLPGHGGYDIFTCKFNGSGWDKPVNLSGKVNTAEDDIAFVINKTDGRTAFLTRKGPDGTMKLFRITPSSDANIQAVFNGVPVPSKIHITSGVTTKRNVLVHRNLRKRKRTTVKIPESNIPVSQPSGAKIVEIKPIVPMSPDQKDVILYRVQIFSSNIQVKEKSVTVNGKSYDLYGYYYLGAYRYCIGEFRSLSPAAELQKICRQGTYPQAYVAAFKNNTRSVDLSLFR